MIVNGVDIMESTINYRGIRTNNLKGIDLDIKKGTIIGIAGPSGSGKSSLAYGTIYAISQNEWGKISDIPAANFQDYRLDSYKNVIPAIAMRQDNFNSNPHSTIATFLRLDRAFRLLYSAKTKQSPSLFSFNNPQSACPYCNGLGYVSIVDENKLIDWNRSVVEKPFLLWKKDQEQKLLEKYAEANGISVHTPLSQLPKIQVEHLLHDKTENKFPVRYKANGKVRTHLFRYIGYLEDIEALQNDKKHVSSMQKLSDASLTTVCPHCHGSRFDEKVLNFKYKNKSIGDLYMMEVGELLPFITKSMTGETDANLLRQLQGVKEVLSGMIDGNLEYLNLNRSIPSLSGGELQRLRLINILNSQIEDMMYIIDEPSARLHVSEYDSLIHDIKRLRDRGNTVLMIEHNPYFLAIADRVIYIGPGAGDDGGYLLKSIPKKKGEIDKCIHHKSEHVISFDGITANNLKNVSVDIALNGITGIYGPSGSGKSTLAKYIAEHYKHTEYISQKVLRGSSVSTIASYSGVMDGIRRVFAQANNVDADYFSFSKELGQCPTCKGKGMLTYEVDFGKTKIEVACEDCNGDRYNKEALSFKYKGMSIVDVLHLTIDRLVSDNVFSSNTGLQSQLHLLQTLGLGYLTLFRTTDTLSGGEAQRLKLTKFIGKRQKDKLFIFDEPLRGLSCNDAINILNLFRKLTDQGATVLFIEHNVLGFRACDNVIEMGPGKGKHGGKIIFAGGIDDFKKSSNWKKYEDKFM